VDNQDDRLSAADDSAMGDMMSCNAA
jgi:hypothetical protein